MHIAAMKPLAVSQEGINKELVEKGEEIFLAQAKKVENQKILSTKW
ncbi:MAG: hypothetical protein CM15mP93_08490 [Thiotrichaceae bacterium]|nr:MAG: hypothetical protein CM15mP93_08490 [Thiotrichaceae bacterium]